MLLCLGILVSNLSSMSRWTEDRNVNDDACYLRQAHLFQRFGLDGLDTTLARDDDGYMIGKMRKFPDWPQSRTSMDAPCHNFIPALDKRILVYPPGTGHTRSSRSMECAPSSSSALQSRPSGWRGREGSWLWLRSSDAWRST